MNKAEPIQISQTKVATPDEDLESDGAAARSLERKVLFGQRGDLVPFAAQTIDDSRDE
jgi:hypothetical protein